ncbi:hypothetical protein COLO4_08319 [Corchorus olitorius]|uniref:RNase H type-1 domain-containing protein n=1 Tax=Corchorus olitorius TaxID=93759 RepID=A0A1R3KGB1_9ROSI|nr:hypothetical protein COLO4_08319 [Corchorus olitorius]
MADLICDLKNHLANFECVTTMSYTLIINGKLSGTGKQVRADEAMVAEALVVTEGLKLAATKHNPKITVETDSAVIANEITKKRVVQ